MYLHMTKGFARSARGHDSSWQTRGFLCEAGGLLDGHDQ